MKKILMGEREGYGTVRKCGGKNLKVLIQGVRIQLFVLIHDIVLLSSIEISIIGHWQMKKLFDVTKSRLRLFGLCQLTSLTRHLGRNEQNTRFADRRSSE